MSGVASHLLSPRFIELYDVQLFFGVGSFQHSVLDQPEIDSSGEKFSYSPIVPEPEFIGYLSHEKNWPHFPLYWLFNRDPL